MRKEILEGSAISLLNTHDIFVKRKPFVAHDSTVEHCNESFSFTTYFFFKQTNKQKEFYGTTINNVDQKILT